MEKEMYNLHKKVQMIHWWFVGRKKIVTSFIDKYKVKSNDISILDLGCGMGVMLETLNKYGNVYGELF